MARQKLHLLIPQVHWTGDDINNKYGVRLTMHEPTGGPMRYSGRTFAHAYDYRYETSQWRKLTGLFILVDKVPLLNYYLRHLSYLPLHKLYISCNEVYASQVYLDSVAKEKQNLEDEFKHRMDNYNTWSLNNKNKKPNKWDLEMPELKYPKVFSHSIEEYFRSLDFKDIYQNCIPLRDVIQNQLSNLAAKLCPKTD